MKSQVSGATRRAAGPFRGETWLALDEAREKVWEIDEAPDETPGKVFGRRKGKDFGGEEENIEHRTFNNLSFEAT